MYVTGRTKLLLRIGTAITLLFIYFPLMVILLYAFNEKKVQTWPIDGLTTEWFDKAFNNPGVRDALWMSIKAGLGATAIALFLGTCAAMAVARHRFFGRETISFLVILPLALPGIVAGSIFTFSLTLGDFITPALVGGAGSSFIGNVVHDKEGQPDIPFAAAFATVPVVVMGIYLVIARRLGAFDAV